MGGKLSAGESSICLLQKQQENWILPFRKQVQVKQTEICQGIAPLGHVPTGQKADWHQRVACHLLNSRFHLPHSAARKHLMS